MKKILSLILLVPLFAIGQYQTERFKVDTVVVNLQATGAQSTYSAGDVVRDPTLANPFLAISTGEFPGQRVWINWIELCVDSSNTTGGQFTLIPYIDTTGVGKYIAADNALMQQKYAFGTKRIPPISLSLTGYGTAAGGATGSWAYTTQINEPFILGTLKKLFFLVIVDGAWKAPYGGHLRLIVHTSYY